MAKNIDPKYVITGLAAALAVIGASQHAGLCQTRCCGLTDAVDDTQEQSAA